MSISFPFCPQQGTKSCWHFILSKLINAYYLPGTIRILGFWEYKNSKVRPLTLGLQEPPQTHEDKELNSVMSNKRESDNSKTEVISHVGWEKEGRLNGRILALIFLMFIGWVPSQQLSFVISLKDTFKWMLVFKIVNWTKHSKSPFLGIAFRSISVIDKIFYHHFLNIKAWPKSQPSLGHYLVILGSWGNFSDVQFHNHESYQYSIKRK